MGPSVVRSGGTPLVPVEWGRVGFCGQNCATVLPPRTGVPGRSYLGTESTPGGSRSRSLFRPGSIGGALRIHHRSFHHLSPMEYRGDGVPHLNASRRVASFLCRSSSLFSSLSQGQVCALLIPWMDTADGQSDGQKKYEYLRVLHVLWGG